MIALATTAIAWIIGLILAIGWLVYALFNARSARREPTRRSSRLAATRSG